MTLLEGDHVQFNISTDRRDKLERATNIDILPDTFHFTKETREMVQLQKFVLVIFLAILLLFANVGFVFLLVFLCRV